jgi:flagella basal body P-ring formation protein FlgA
MRKLLPLLLVALIVSLAIRGATGQVGKPKTSATARPVANQARKTPVPAPDTSPITVTVKVSAEVVGRSFTLGEIADISGKDATLIRQLAAVEVGASPLPGQSRTLYPGDIVVKLRANRLESGRVMIIAPPTMKVARARRDVTSEEMTRAALNAVQEVVQDQPDTTLEAQAPVQEIVLPKGQVEFRAGAYRGRLEQGTLYVPISILVDDRPVQTVEVIVKVKRKMRVLLANRQIEPNEILSPDDVFLARIELPPGFARPLTVTKEAIGKRAKRRILADTPISATFLETPNAISFNDRVTIESVYGPVRITVPGVARQSGAIGDFIRVYAPDTKKEVEAQIIDSQTVRLGTTDRSPATDKDRG